jgi:hypothetical protein
MGAASRVPMGGRVHITHIDDLATGWIRHPYLNVALDDDYIACIPLHSNDTPSLVRRGNIGCQHLPTMMKIEPRYYRARLGSCIHLF